MSTPTALSNFEAATAQNNDSAQVEAGEPNADPAFLGAGACVGGQTPFGHTLWYSVPGTGRQISFSMSGESHESFTGAPLKSAVAVYDLALAGVTCNELVVEHRSTSAFVQFSSQAGHTYYVQTGTTKFDSVVWDHGVFTLTPAAQAAVNDLRPMAESVPGGTVTRDNYGATAGEPSEAGTCGPVAYDSTIWFRYSHPKSGGQVTFTARATGGADPVIAVYQGASTAALVCNDDTAPDARAEVSLTGLAAGDYFVQVGANKGSSFSQGFFDYSVVADFDLDNDGIEPPTDCDDSNAGIRPGLADTPGNGVDEDCSGADAVVTGGGGGGTGGGTDPDGDGVVGAADRCPSENARDRDVDRDGCIDPPYLRYLVTLAISRTKRGVVAEQLDVTAPRGTRVSLRCSKRRCSREVKTARRLRFPAIRGRKLPVGTVMEIRITKRNTIGALVRYTIIKRKGLGAFRRTDLCLFPSSSRARACE